MDASSDSLQYQSVTAQYVDEQGNPIGTASSTVDANTGMEEVVVTASNKWWVLGLTALGFYLVGSK